MASMKKVKLTDFQVKDNNRVYFYFINFILIFIFANKILKDHFKYIEFKLRSQYSIQIKKSIFNSN